MQATKPSRAVPTNEDALLTPKDAASYIGWHLDTIYRHIKDGTLPAHRVGPRSIRIRRSSLEAFVSGEAA